MKLTKTNFSKGGDAFLVMKNSFVYTEIDLSNSTGDTCHIDQADITVMYVCIYCLQRYMDTILGFGTFF